MQITCTNTKKAFVLTTLFKAAEVANNATLAVCPMAFIK
jgi:hypothetical protein